MSMMDDITIEQAMRIEEALKKVIPSLPLLGVADKKDKDALLFLQAYIGYEICKIHNKI